MLPNVFIAGAQKSGTSSLYHLMEAHEEIAVTVPKEPTFFSRKARLSDTGRYDEYFSHCDSGRNTVALEASTGYLYEEYAAERIHQTLGSDVKFIFILRDPVQRSISAYWHTYKRFDELRDPDSALGVRGNNFQELRECEKNNLEKAINAGKIKTDRYKKRYDDFCWPFYYVSNSFYSVHIKKFVDIFTKNNICIIFSEQFRDDPHTTLSGISSFLNLNRPFIHETPPRYNKTIIPRKNKPINSLVHRIARSSPGTAIRKKISVLDNFYTTRFWHGDTRIDSALQKQLFEQLSADYDEMSRLSNTNVYTVWENHNTAEHS